MIHDKLFGVLAHRNELVVLPAMPSMRSLCSSEAVPPAGNDGSWHDGGIEGDEGIAAPEDWREGDAGERRRWQGRSSQHGRIDGG